MILMVTVSLLFNYMTAPAKIDRLMSVLAIGFVLSCRSEEAEDKRRPFKVKKHGRPAQNLFRAGLDRLVSVLFRGMRLLEVLGCEIIDLLRKYSSHRINQSCNQICP